MLADEPRASASNGAPARLATKQEAKEADDVSASPVCAICKGLIVARSARIIVADQTIAGIAHLVCWVNVRVNDDDRVERARHWLAIVIERLPTDTRECEAREIGPECECARCLAGQAHLTSLRLAGKIGPGSPMRRKADRERKELHRGTRTRAT